MTHPCRHCGADTGAPGNATCGSEECVAAVYSRTDREITLRRVLGALRSPLVLMSKPMRETMLAAVRECDPPLTVEELLEIAVNKARNT
jgi:hypothetical protein